MYVERERERFNFMTLLLALLAASGQNRCSGLVCSCYVTSRNFDRKSENSNRSSSKRLPADGVMEEVYDSRLQGQGYIESGSKSNGPHIIRQPPPSTLKSNLKKTAIVQENQQRSTTEKRKVNWPDAHGKDIAHIQEFEPSVSEEGEFEGVRNSCVCAIQ